MLYPAVLRDLLIRLARTGLFHARWSDQIHEEWVQAVLRKRPDLADALQRTRTLMNSAVDDALVTGFEPLIPRLTLPDPDDRHVLAAAIAARADVIVTLNLKHFPADALAPCSIEAHHPDIFMRHILDLDEPSALTAVRDHRASLKKPAFSPGDYLALLLRQGLVETVTFLRPWSELI